MNRTLLLVCLALAACGPKEAPPEVAAAATPPPAPPWPAMPEPGPMPAFAPPAAEQFALSNGLKVTYVRAGSVPLVQLQLNVFTGSKADPVGRSGLAAFAADMLNESTKKRGAVAISDALQDLATDVWFGAGHDASYGGLESLEDTLDQSLALFAEMLTQPAFAEADVQRVRDERIAQIKTQKDSVARVAWNVFNRYLFGDAGPGRGSEGSQKDLAAIGRKDLLGWYTGVWGPENASLVVASGLPREQIQAALEKALGSWKAKVRPPKNLAVTAPARTGRTILWVDRTNAAQSYVLVGNVGPAFDPALAAARVLGNRPLGGSFTSRINLNLREEKHWTYGARSGIDDGLDSGSYAAYASIEAQFTAPGLKEIVAELEAVVGGEPLTDAEFLDGRSGLLQSWPAAFERLGAVLSQYAQADLNRRPEGWVAGFGERVVAVDRAAAQAELSAIIQPADLVVVIVGDRAAHGAAVEALGLGPILAFDDEGNPIP